MALPAVVKSAMHIKPHTITAPKKGGGPRPGKKKTIVAPNKAPSVAIKKVG